MDLLIRHISYPLSIMDRFRQSLHIAGKARTYGRAMCKEEIGDDDLTAKAIQCYGHAFLVSERKIFYLVPDRIIYPFAFLSDCNYGIRKVMAWHRYRGFTFPLDDKISGQWQQHGQHHRV